MKAIVLEKPGNPVQKDLPDPAPRPGEIVVRVGACGVCGTDLHIADGEFPPSPYPLVPGHEFAGEVTEVGDEVPPALVATGDRVAIDPSLFCGYCKYCRAGRGNLCENWGAIGDTVDGAFAEFVTVPAVNAYRLPDKLDYRQGAIVEPLSCAVHASKLLGPVLGARVLIIGAGTMGLLLLQLVARSGAASLTVVDRAAGRLDIATTLGAGTVTTDAKDLGNRFYDVCIDATGAAPAIEAAFDRVDRGGRLMIFGVASEAARVSLSPFRIYNDEINVIGSMAVLHSFGEAMQLMSVGAIVTEPLLRFPPLPLAGYPDALAAVRRGEGIKVQVDPRL